ASLAALGAAVSGADIIKVGLKGPKNVEEGVNLMKNVVKAVKNYNKDIKIVVAGYADYKRIKSSPDFLSIPIIAAESGSDIAMLDTFIKDGKGLFDFLSVEQLMDFKKISKQANLDIALAGNLMKESISKIKKISPDIIGVRSIVCDNYDRQKGKIRAHMIEELKNYLY
ncbi:MAG: (5-formylfuran-3-yl)methyl phosphate synthase, partial [Candidatus Lokiarchaeota archaeon]|nr:(5-formylfuran-3-yl)methyl phosphate synthase [Candidatus Lokiarchaeota archaeon]